MSTGDKRNLVREFLRSPWEQRFSTSQQLEQQSTPLQSCAETSSQQGNFGGNGIGPWITPSSHEDHIQSSRQRLAFANSFATTPRGGAHKRARQFQHQRYLSATNSPTTPLAYHHNPPTSTSTPTSTVVATTKLSSNINSTSQLLHQELDDKASIAPITLQPPCPPASLSLPFCPLEQSAIIDFRRKRASNSSSHYAESAIDQTPTQASSEETTSSRSSSNSIYNQPAWKYQQCQQQQKQQQLYSSNLINKFTYYVKQSGINSISRECHSASLNSNPLSTPLFTQKYPQNNSASYSENNENEGLGEAHTQSINSRKSSLNYQSTSSEMDSVNIPKYLQRTPLVTRNALNALMVIEQEDDQYSPIKYKQQPLKKELSPGKRTQAILSPTSRTSAQTLLHSSLKGSAVKEKKTINLLPQLKGNLRRKKPKLHHSLIAESLTSGIVNPVERMSNVRKELESISSNKLNNYDFSKASRIQRNEVVTENQKSLHESQQGSLPQKDKENIEISARRQAQMTQNGMILQHPNSQQSTTLKKIKEEEFRQQQHLFINSSKTENLIREATAKMNKLAIREEQADELQQSQSVEFNVSGMQSQQQNRISRLQSYSIQVYPLDEGCGQKQKRLLRSQKQRSSYSPAGTIAATYSMKQSFLKSRMELENKSTVKLVEPLLENHNNTATMTTTVKIPPIAAVINFPQVSVNKHGGDNAAPTTDKQPLQNQNRQIKILNDFY